MDFQSTASWRLGMTGKTFEVKQKYLKFKILFCGFAVVFLFFGLVGPVSARLPACGDSGVYCGQETTNFLCHDGADNDNNGTADKDDPSCTTFYITPDAPCDPSQGQCAAAPSCNIPPPSGCGPEDTAFYCHDGFDNDNDLKVDESDPSCTTFYITPDAPCDPSQGQCATTPTTPPTTSGNTSASGVCGPGYDAGTIPGLCIPRNVFTGQGPATAKTVGELITRILSILLTLAGVLAVVYLIVGGFRYLTSGGNKDQAEKAKKAITGAVVGLGIVILSYAVVYIVTNLLTGRVL